MNLAEFHFIRPYWLLAFIPAITITVLLLRNKLNQGNWSNVCDAELLPFVLQEKPVNRSHWVLSATALASLLTIIALAGPTWERSLSPVFRNDAALVIALDLSRSMDAGDIKPSRLSLARYKIADILKQRKDGQTALIVYAGDAFIVTPLTEDTETIASQISALTTGIMPSQGSNTALALEKAVELLKQAGLQKGEILLITDGADLDNTLDTVKSLKGYHLSVLGVGTHEGAPIKASGGDFIKDQQGNIVVPKLNESDLSQLASVGGGVYRRISNDDGDIEALLSALDSPVEKQESADNNLLIDQWKEQGPWLLLAVLPLAALSFRKGLLSLALLCLLPFPKPSYAMEWNELWTTRNQQAQQAFKQENYQQATEQFDNPQWKAASQYKAGQYQQAAELLKDDSSAEGLYNLGNALAKAGQLAEAKTAYEKSLEINPANEDAKYNKEQVEKQLEKQQQQDQQQGDDKKESESDDSEKQDKKGDKRGDDSEQSGEPDKSEKDSDSEQESKPSEQDKADEESDKTEEQSAQEQQQQEAKETESSQAAESSEYDESEQAKEQWLNSIPDDPAGLLKRKFKYQYGQQGRKSNNNQAW
ncbi:MAG: VWA domain-containing protein [Methylomarinum sp.]|nr:VWA domain-containing protein [Methylomarinum sp.]